ncbi:MAG: hypothetical protein COU31_03510 [Candidatus Magasanikbacteria bacterium CG10_big_fil_rev_8_21_14_0_10_40_10]|uniref:Phospholipase C/D domain-containing protein n=1 Tax=Candidatus Magasanikbacteria bacterium CG10_big_fil_rev_8_21_14_0_10_40_10 TaxID=1974648 RepID=A0A2M6W3G2_9BACT|nr:MAG: hypothetical protein COU31_03510 [Candidatus Magasanikbacteria bacterium CG10_big_fil_rev_8_21_14_0_10_40_10]
MALEATHIKFALDLREKYSIKKLDVYLSGAIYPDSRYLTKIDRKLCHRDEVLAPEFADNDFKKGWAIHFLGDKTQNRALDIILPDLLGDDKIKVWGTPWWINKTAVKNIADIEIFKNFDIQPYLPLLDYVENPHNEDIDKIKKYNQIVQKLYQGKNQITLQDIGEFWIDLGLSEEMTKKVLDRTKEYLSDSDVVEKIKSLYPKMLELAKEF